MVKLNNELASRLTSTSTSFVVLACMHGSMGGDLPHKAWRLPHPSHHHHLIWCDTTSIFGQQPLLHQPTLESPQTSHLELGALGTPHSQRAIEAITSPHPLRHPPQQPPTCSLCRRAIGQLCNPFQTRANNHLKNSTGLLRTS